MDTSKLKLFNTESNGEKIHSPNFVGKISNKALGFATGHCPFLNLQGENLLPFVRVLKL